MPSLGLSVLMCNMRGVQVLKAFQLSSYMCGLDPLESAVFGSVCLILTNFLKMDYFLKLNITSPLDTDLYF